MSTSSDPKTIGDAYLAGDLSLEDAAAQLSELLGAQAEEELDPRISALLDAVQPQTTIWPCAVTVTAATSCSRWCG